MLNKGITNQNHALCKENVLQIGYKKEQENNFPQVTSFLQGRAKNWTYTSIDRIFW